MCSPEKLWKFELALEREGGENCCLHQKVSRKKVNQKVAWGSWEGRGGKADLSPKIRKALIQSLQSAGHIGGLQAARGPCSMVVRTHM